jgi:hypothetical protein
MIALSRVALILSLLAPGVRAVSLSEYCASKGMVPEGVEGQGEWGCKPRDGGGDSSGRDDGAARRAAQRAAQDAAAARRQREENERRRKQREAQLEFDRRQAEALGQFQDLESGELELKGLDDDGGGGRRGGATRGARAVLRSQVTPNSGLRGYSDEPEPAAKACRVVDSCMKALEDQERALEQARLDQKDLYWAMGSADFKHGIDILQAAMKEGPLDPQMPPLYVYREKDKAGLPFMLNQYRVTFDDILLHLHKEKVAYIEGRKGPLPKDVAAELKGRALEAARKKAEEKAKARAEEDLVASLKGEKQRQAEAKKITDYIGYIRSVLRCSEGDDRDFNRCVEAANKALDKAMGLATKHMKVPAMQARLKAASGALRGYSDAALRRAQAAALAASRCLEGCQR